MSETNVMPLHLGIILDGNRRWAKANGLAAIEGHRKGTEVFREISRAAFQRGIKYVSGYVWSTENWKRTESEVNYIMSLIIKAADNYLNEIHKEGIKIVILGRRDGLRTSVARTIKKVESKTAANTKGTIAICFNYGGQQEIADAANALKNKGEAITVDTLRSSLYYPEVPDVDFIIRTSGEQRISNFMLWRAAYAELYFIKKHFPAFTVRDLDDALADFAKRDRRIGS
jgi:undecaprenyl diphosphate synthase